MMKFFRKVRDRLFGATTISVGHGVVRRTHSAVILFIGRRFVALTPDGARKVADQLRVWADHAETRGNAISCMKFIVKVSMKSDADVAAQEWVTEKLTASATELSDDR